MIIMLKTAYNHLKTNEFFLYVNPYALASSKSTD